MSNPQHASDSYCHFFAVESVFPTGMLWTAQKVNQAVSRLFPERHVPGKCHYCNSSRFVLWSATTSLMNIISQHLINKFCKEKCKHFLVEKQSFLWIHIVYHCFTFFSRESSKEMMQKQPEKKHCQNASVMACLRLFSTAQPLRLGEIGWICSALF